MVSTQVQVLQVSSGPESEKEDPPAGICHGDTPEPEGGGQGQEGCELCVQGPKCSSAPRGAKPRTDQAASPMAPLSRPPRAARPSSVWFLILQPLTHHLEVCILCVCFCPGLGVPRGQLFFLFLSAVPSRGPGAEEEPGKPSSLQCRHTCVPLVHSGIPVSRKERREGKREQRLGEVV